MIAARPAAIVKRMGKDAITPVLRAYAFMDVRFINITDWLRGEPPRSGFVTLRCEDIESVVAGFWLGETKSKSPEGGTFYKYKICGMTVRAVGPFNWRNLFSQWNLDLVEIKGLRGSYYKLKDPKKAEFFKLWAIFLPDDRTLVFDLEETIKGWVAGDPQTAPDYLMVADWQRASRSVLALAIDNRDAGISRWIALALFDDASMIPLLRGVDRWIISLDDTDDLTLRADASAHDPQSSAALMNQARGLAKRGRAALANSAQQPGGVGRMSRLASDCLENFSISQSDHSLTFKSKGFGTFADLASILLALFAKDDGIPRQASSSKPERRPGD
ncbi:hypothetical protein [Singulisphaera sp. PoT]|uniref:hypothetical protein n=1 Tax=Singulisphaera sp. PoT TaxID=3411797 RepID=UPI003BF53480